MYNINDLPTFTYAGAMKPKKDYANIMRNVSLVACIIILIAANVM